MIKNAKLTYDKEADAMYISLEKIKPRSVKQTVQLKEDILLDLDSEKKIIGIEILNASKNMAKESLRVAEATA